MKKFLFALATTLFAGTSGFIDSTFAKEKASENLMSLVDTPLTEILQRHNITVTSVSKKSERVSEAASAVHVITAEDIRRSGLNSLPEVLRLAPGIHVAQIDASRWAISSRGMSDQFANKLLVMIDGREIYSPLFSGVYWDMNDIVLEDIERIEVIRGPGATLWGANAVNGVINVITKNTIETPESFASASLGTFEKYSATVRMGGEYEEDLGYRVYAKTQAKSNTDRLIGGSNNDDWNQQRVGFRADSKKEDGELMLSGEAFKSKADILLNLPDITAPAPFKNVVRNDEERDGGFLLAKYNKQVSQNSNLNLQAYIDRSIRNGSTLKQTVDILNFDFSHSYKYCDWSEFIWGAGYRNISDSYGNTFFVRLTPEEDTRDIYSSFVQNKFSLVPNKLFLTLGTKFEHNSYTGSEFQPSGKLLWQIDENNSVWSSVSHAVRSTNRAENDIFLIANNHPAGTGYLAQVSNKDLESEELNAYEIGYRTTLNKNTFLDVTGFYNQYNNLRTLEPQANTVLSGITYTPFKAYNFGAAKSYGTEFAAFHEVNEKLALRANYSIMNIETEQSSASNDSNFKQQEGTSPDNSFSVGASYEVSENIELDANYYFVDNLENLNVNSYQRLDTKISYLPDKDTEIALVGQNLLDDKHQEFAAPLNGFAAEIPRAVLLKYSRYF